MRFKVHGLRCRVKGWEAKARKAKHCGLERSGLGGGARKIPGEK